MSSDSFTPVLDQLATHPRRDDLARLVELHARSVVTGVIGGGRPLDEAAKLGLAAADVETPLGNVLAVLEHGAQTEQSRALVASLLAHAIALRGGQGQVAGPELSRSLVWLASQGAAASPDQREVSVDGELTAAPRGPLATVLLGVTGLLLVAGVVRLTGRLVLAHRRPTTVTWTPSGLSVSVEERLLGKALRERQVVIPPDGLMRATREVRYPGLPMYAGLLALTLGSYLGMGFVVDGLRAASLSMVGFGALVLMAGIAIDFALASLLPGTGGKCRLLLVPRRGAAVCVGSVDIAAADALLGAIAKR